MAFPTINGTKTSTDEGMVTHTLALPVLSTEDMLFAWIHIPEDYSITIPSGWTLYRDHLWAGNRRAVMCFQVVTGSEGYAGDGTDTVTFSTGSAVDSAHCTYSITGVIDPDTQLPTHDSSSTQYDPPNHSPGSTEDFLWIAACLTSQVSTAYPSGYSNGIGVKTGIISSDVATKALNAASENPGVFSFDGSSLSVSYTIAFWPGEISREVTDPVGVTDSVTTVLNYSRTITDAVGVTDSVTTTITYNRTVTDSVGISDSAVRAMSLARTIIDSVGIIDSVTVIDSGSTYTFTPTTAGHSIPIGKETQGGEPGMHSLWNHYGKAIPVQIHIIFTSGTSVLIQIPDQDTMDLADSGSGRGDKMIYPTPGGPYTITGNEAIAIIADGTYADDVG